MKVYVIVEPDYETNVLARRLKTMGFTLNQVDSRRGIITCEKVDLNLKELRKARGVRSVENV